MYRSREHTIQLQVCKGQWTALTGFSTVATTTGVQRKQVPAGIVYDFITATEVLEHLHQPRRDLEAVWSCLQSDGWLGVMTKRARNREAFDQWHYKQDPTHVCFWSDATLQWLADHWNAHLELIGPDVALLQK